MDDDEQEPARAMLLPHSMAFRCPCCGDGVGEIEVEEGQITGEFRVPDSERFRHCECGAFLDIGWAGWGWHDNTP